MANPIFNQITKSIETAVNSMTVIGGFRYDYSRANDYNFKTRTFPNVLITFPEEIGEDNDEMVNSYTSTSEIFFDVVIDDSEPDSDLYLDGVIEDLKRLMENEHEDFQIVGLCVADFLGTSREYTNVRQRPAKAKIVFDIKYRIKRSNPSNTI